MAIQLSTSARNALLDAIETTISTTAKLQIRSGAAPANCAAANSGTLLCEMTLPSDWWAAAASGAKAKSGTWSGTGDAAAGAGTNAAHFRIFDNAGTTCHLQGTVTASGGGGDMTLDNVSIASGQAVAVSTFNLTAPGA